MREPGRPGPAIDLRKLNVLGKYFLMAMQLAAISSESELARLSGLDVSTIGKLMKGQGTVKDTTLFRLCDVMQTPDWLEERIAAAAGYASRRQRALVADATAISEAEARVREAIEQRKNQQ